MILLAFSQAILFGTLFATVIASLPYDQSSITVSSYQQLVTSISEAYSVIYVNDSIIITDEVIIIDSDIEIIGITYPFPIFSSYSSRVFSITNSTVHIKSLRFRAQESSLLDDGGLISIINSTAMFTSVSMSGGNAICGGGIFASNSSISILSSQFYDNFATISSSNSRKASCNDGGAIVLLNGIANITSSTFLTNAAIRGGAVSLINCTSISIVRSYFGHNSAFTLSGGALLVTGADTLRISNTSFVSNFASDGGAASIQVCRDVALIDLNFENNTATGNLKSSVSFGFGGALEFVGGAVFISATFLNNRGLLGGAMSVLSGEVSISDSEFFRNHANLGGAINCQRNCSLSVQSSSFRYNSADSSGGSFQVESGSSTRLVSSTVVLSSTLNGFSTGGVANCLYSSFSISKSEFLNSTSQTGSHIYGFGCSIEIISSNFSFGNALVSHGIFANDESKLSIENSIVSHNKAKLVGGGVSCLAASRCIVNNTHFVSNNASAAGALYIASCAASVIDGSFTNNVAVLAAAAFIDVKASASFLDVIFEGNIAETYGGAVAIEDDSSSSFNNCIFSGNSALVGGAMYSIVGKIDIENCQFKKNNADQEGGVISAGKSTLIVRASSFTGSTSAYGAVINAQGNVVVTFENIYAANNRASLGGGLLAAFYDVDFTLIDSQIINNLGTIGGVINAQYKVSLSIENTTFENNRGEDISF